MATGQLIGFFSAASFYASDSSAPQWTHRNNVPVLAYDATTDEYADTLGVVPPNYSGNGVYVDIDFITDDTTDTHVSSWLVQFEKRATGGDDLDSSSFATAVIGSGTANATAGKVCTARLTVSHASFDSPSAGDMYRMRITRDGNGSSGTDDITSDCHVQGVYITEQ